MAVAGNYHQKDQIMVLVVAVVLVVSEGLELEQLAALVVLG